VLRPWASELFAAVVTCEDVVNGKPAPDLYLLAADRLGAARHMMRAASSNAF